MNGAVYDCKFCSVPKFQGKIKTLDEVLEIVESDHKAGKLKAIAFTSGVATTPENEIDRVVEYVQAVKKYHVPIGVAVHPTEDSSQRLRDAGVTEVKYNVETMDREIFERVCIRKKRPLARFYPGIATRCREGIREEPGLFKHYYRAW